MLTEAETCRKHAIPMLRADGWDNELYMIVGQRSIIDGRLVLFGKMMTFSSEAHTKCNPFLDIHDNNQHQ